MPEWKIGIEYQGIQHDRPVDYFGGIDAWVLTVARDARKRAKCKELAITLIEVRPGYDPGDLCAEIVRAREAFRQGDLPGMNSKTPDENFRESSGTRG
jgi:hypothetical protein